ncbi:MAG: mechanosensitive ion channel protein, partial [Halobacillus sp.]
MNIFEEGFKFNPSVVVEWIITGGLKILLLLIAFAIVKPLGKKAIGAAMKRMSNQRKLSEGRSQTLEKLAINIFSYSSTFIFIVMLLSALSIDIGP